MTSAPDIQLMTIPQGYAGTLTTVDHVIDLITSGAKDFHVRQSAIAILKRREVRPKDYLGEIKALFEWVQHHVRYTRDPFRVEVLHSPRRMLELRAGDCDDMSILLGALLESIGHSVRIVLTGMNPRRPDVFTHIYIEVRYRGRWLPLDATMPHPMGWSPRAPVRKVISIAKAQPAIGGHPDGVVNLGRLTGVMYRADRWREGRPRTFIHFMEDPPRLVSNAAGTQLYVVGGRYRVTARGIEG